MALNRRLVQVGIAKQAVKGTAITPPVYGFGVTGGAIMAVDIAEPVTELTAANRMNASAIRERAVPAAGWNSLAFSRSFGLLLLGALGSVSTTGSVDPYSHVFTPADDLPWLTIYGKYHSEYQRVVDAKINTLTLNIAVGKLTYSVSLMGHSLDPNHTVWTATNSDDDTTPGPLLTPGVTGNLGAISIDGATARVTEGTLNIANNLDVIVPASKVLPDEINPAVLAINGSLTVVPDNLLLWRQVITGAAAGTATAVGTTPYYGDFSLKWAESANHDLTVVSAADKVRFMVPFPDADPAGGAAPLAVTFDVLRPASGAALTATLRSAMASY